MKIIKLMNCFLLAIILLILRLSFKNSDKNKVRTSDNNQKDSNFDKNKTLLKDIQKDFNFSKFDDFSESQPTDNFYESPNECFNETLIESVYEKFDGKLNLSSDNLSSSDFNFSFIKSQKFKGEKIRKIAKASYEKFIRSDKNDSYFGCNEYDSSGSDKYGTRPRLQKKKKFCIKFKNRTTNQKIKSRKGNLVKNGKFLMISPKDLEKMNFIVSPHEDRNTQSDNRLIEF